MIFGGGVVLKVLEKNGNIIIKDVTDFNIEQIFECGQCFHFEKLADMDYVTVAYGRALRVSQSGSEVVLHKTDMAEYNAIWKKYFDMDTDYTAIKNRLIECDDSIRDAVRKAYGIRILKQEFHEMLLSFIISQNKQIPHIKQIVKNISEKYGTKAGNIMGNDYYNFPDVLKIRDITEENYREIKTGFRAPYLYDAGRFLSEGLNEAAFDGLSYEAAKDKLTAIKGVGDKVANCVLLFGLGYTNAFPVDVWVKRIMEQVYFKEDTSKDVIMEFAKQKFGEYGGYAQQYLFYYVRENAVNKGRK